MSTERQIEANRRNAQLSTGPRTPEGRAAVRLNGVKHGLTAQTLILPGESVEDFEAHLTALEQQYRPSNPTEEMLVRYMAMAYWRLRRLYHTEASYYKLQLIDLPLRVKDYEELGEQGKPAVVLAYGIGGTLTGFSQLEGRLERSFYRALRELQRLKAEAAAAPEKLGNQTQSAAPEPAALFALPKRINEIPVPEPPCEPGKEEANNETGVPIER